MSSPTTFAQSVAAELRAEMARQRKSTTELASALNISQSSASRRFSGEQAMSLDEINAVAIWLKVPVTMFFAQREAA